MRLFLCEKPSQGKDIGRLLGARQRGNGCLNGPGVVVTWCIGHLVEAAPPEAYDEQLKRWTIEQLPIIPQHWRVEVKPKTAAQFKVVKDLLSILDYGSSFLSNPLGIRKQFVNFGGQVR